MENIPVETIIAAILTAGLAAKASDSAPNIVKKYRRVLHELRESGGIYEAATPPGPSKSSAKTLARLGKRRER